MSLQCSKIERRFFFIFVVCGRALSSSTFRYPVIVETIGDRKHQDSPFGPFLKSHNEGLLENAEKDVRSYLFTLGRCTEARGFGQAN